jgi:hypothetical protein
MSYLRMRDNGPIVHYGKFLPMCGGRIKHLRLSKYWGMVTCYRCKAAKQRLISVLEVSDGQS